LQSMTALGVEIKNESQVAITLNKLRTILEKHLGAVEEGLKEIKDDLECIHDNLNGPEFAGIHTAVERMLTILNGEGK